MVYLAEYSIWSVLQEKVDRSKLADVDELKTRLIDEWAQFDQSIVAAAIDQPVASSSIKALLFVYSGHTSSINYDWTELLYKLIILLNKP